MSNNNLQDVEKLNFRPFTRFCMSIGAVPSSYLAGLSIEEQMLWLCSYLEKEVIGTVNNNAEALEEVQRLMVELQQYVDHYFDNLDVQEEINNKLDDLVEDGTLENLIGAYIQPRIDAQNEVIQEFASEVNTELGTLDTKILNLQTSTNSALTTQNTTITNFQTSVNSSLADMEAQLDSVSSGAPLVASSTAGMSDTSRIYVNTTDGKWYYYDGAAWVAGGTYQASGLSDGSVTLNILGTDVKFNLNTRINEAEDLDFNDLIALNLSDNLLRKSIGSGGQIGGNSTTRVCSNNLIYIPTGTLINVAKNTYNYEVRCYFYDKDFNYLDQSFVSQISSNPLVALPFAWKYIRFRFAKADQSQTLTTQEVIDNVSITFEKNPLLKNSGLEKGTNLLNAAKYLDGYLNGANYPYTRVETGSYKSTFIPITNGTTYCINKFRKFALYDKNMMYVASSFIDTSTTNHTFTATFDGYVGFSWNTSNNYMVVGTSGSYTPYIEKLPDYVQLQNVSNLTSLIEGTNILVGKKYVALGDSFTHGDFSDSPTNDYTIESGTYSGEYKVYPFLIGNRNLMTVSNLAANGMTITNVNGTSNNYLSNAVLEQIPEDTDYITIKIGINDNHQNASIGSINDNTSTTFYGSWNRVMNYLITNYPEAKIGIIVSNGITNADYVTATIAIAKKYGVSYINEANDDRVPLLIRTLRNDVAASIKTLRDNDWEVLPGTNGHPNAKCHEYESTIIENFLRTL